jgi:hypothetical protein
MTSRKTTKKCLYCNNRDHTILKCKKDSMMFLTLSGKELQEKNKLRKFSKKQLLRLTVEVCRHYITPPNGTSTFIEHVSPHCNKEKVVDFVHSLTNNLLKKEKKECPICYEELGKTKCRTSCGHEFCTGCFSKIFTTSRHSPTCPMCREPLTNPTHDNRQEIHRNLHGYRTGSHIPVGVIEEQYQQQVEQQMDNRLRAAPGRL